MIFPDDQVTKFRALHQYGSRPETSGGMISSRPTKCRYTIPVHTVSLWALVCTLKDYVRQLNVFQPFGWRNLSFISFSLSIFCKMSSLRAWVSNELVVTGLWKSATMSTSHHKAENALSEEEFDQGWLWQSELLTQGRLGFCRNSGCQNSGCRNSGLYPLSRLDLSQVG